jgi:hypothetical protein
MALFSKDCRGAWCLAAATAAIGLATTGVAMAHHSFAMFDNEHQIKIAGTVSKLEWGNPHIYIFLTGGEMGKEAKTWTIEGASPGILNRIGWKFNVVKQGDKVTMIVAPIRSGEPAGLLKEIKLPDGRVLNNGGFAGPALIKID